MIYKLSEILTSYVEKNIEQKYQPVAVGKYGIRKREDIYKKELAKDYSKNKVIRKDTLTIGMGSTQIDIGILVENEVYSVSPAYHTYKINTSIVYSEFLEWILKEMNPELSKLYMISSARQGKSVDFERMMNHKINIPTLDKQLIIIKKLKHIDNLISNMKTNYSKYDEIVKSQFIEMFGDPLLDDGRYPKVPLGTLAEVGSSKRIFEKEYVSEGVPFYRTKEIVELSKGNRITTELFITRDRYDKIRDEYGVPQKGDLLISAVGTIGVIWIVDGKNDFYFKDGNLLRVASTEKFAPTYIKHLLEALIGAYKQEMSSGTAYAALTISALKEMLVYEVPIA